jgi:hypothetical protein
MLLDPQMKGGRYCFSSLEQLKKCVLVYNMLLNSRLTVSTLVSGRRGSSVDRSMRWRELI